MCCKKVELLVRGGDEKILAVVILPFGIDLAVVADNPVALLFAEGRVGQDHVEGPPAGAQQCVARLDRAFASGNVVQVEVHRTQPHDLRHDIDAGEARAHRGIDFGVARQRLLPHVLPGSEQKPAGAAGGVMDRLARIGIDDRHDGLDQRARGEVLPGAGLHLLRVAFQEALVDRALHIDAEAEPAFAVDQANQPLQSGRVLDFVLRLQEDRADNTRLPRQLVEDGAIAPGQRLALQIAQYRPAATGRDRRRFALQQPRRNQRHPLLVHLEEQQIRDLRDIGLIRHALVAQYMREIPHLLDERGTVHCFGPPNA